jgi:hypothetical protein
MRPERKTEGLASVVRRLHTCNVHEMMGIARTSPKKKGWSSVYGSQDPQFTEITICTSF